MWGHVGRKCMGTKVTATYAGGLSRMNGDEAVNGSDDDNANHEGNKTILNSSFTF